MKPQAQIAFIAMTLISLSACSNNSNYKKKSDSQQNTLHQQSSPSNHISSQQRQQLQQNKRNIQRVSYQRNKRVSPQLVVYQPSSSAQANRQSLHQQRAAHQQVRRPQVRVRHSAPRAIPRRVQAPKHQNPAQANMKELYAIGDKIFNNETGGRIDQLVHWNEREDFAAMGIGHFTWYPRGRSQRFGNTFPELLDYLQKNGINLPHWVQRARFEGAPWRSRGELMRAKGSPEVRQFAQLLYDTRHLQAKYIMDRAMRAMPRLVKKTPPQLRSHVANNLNAVANSQGGRYVLIDYVNFKGEGLNRHGGYKRQNWGLLQVLEEMQPASVGSPALNEFANAAMRVLERRVRNSDPRRNERKWLSGWRNRTNTYRNPV